METEWLFIDFSENEMVIFVFVLMKINVWEKNNYLYILKEKLIKPL